ncbi:hypothetical protein F383_05439 [Gossypium arboreum]|uniref:Uncharacterized protein n=1 Tax=Gossypium arboreum TaxID=29729 RepID=A0A0B0PK96_GOSAR|nr:hypothetical protein F383_05439 [Gossypium arboreum]
MYLKLMIVNSRNYEFKVNCDGINYDHDNMVNYISLCCVTCMLMFGKVSLFLSYEFTKLYSLLHFYFPCFIVSPS